jgi:hypothetical protein
MCAAKRGQSSTLDSKLSFCGNRGSGWRLLCPEALLPSAGYTLGSQSVIERSMTVSHRSVAFGNGLLFAFESALPGIPIPVGAWIVINACLRIDPNAG